MGESGRHKIKTKSSIFIKIFVLNLNVWALYLFLNFKQFIYFPLATLLLFLVVLLIKYLQNVKTRSKPFVHKTDLIRLSLKYLRINKKHLIVAIIGIILSTIIISQVIILSSTYERQLFDNKFGNELPPVAQFTINDRNNSLDANSLFSEIEPEVIKKFDDQGLEYERGKTNKMLRCDILTTQYWSGDEMNSLRTMRNRISTIDEDLYEFFRGFPSFDENKTPYDPSKTYFLDTLNSYFQYDLNQMELYSEVQISLGETFWNKSVDISDVSFMNMSYHVDYFWLLSEEDIDYFSETYGYSNSYYVDIVTGSLLMNESAQIRLIGDILEYRDEFGIKNTHPYHYFQYYLSIDDVSKKNLEEILPNIERLGRNLRYIVERYEENNQVRIPLYYEIHNFLEENVLIRFTLLLASIPMLILSLFLTYFSIALAEKRKRRIITMMKYRGTSGSQIQAVLISEILSTSIITTVSGMILSIPYSIWIITKESIFNVKFITISGDWYWKLPLIGIVLGVNLNIGSIISLSKININDTEYIEDKIKPLWQRMYIDLIFVSLSILIWILLRTIPLESYLKEGLVFGLGPFALIFLIIGSPLILARYFSQFINILSDNIWRVGSNLAVLASRNLRINSFSSSRLTALICIGFMLSIMSMSIPHSLEQNIMQEAYYNVGSDILITGIDSSNSTQLKLLDNEDIEGYTEIVESSIYNPISSDEYFSGHYINRYNFLGINVSNFADVVYWEDSYAKFSINDIVQSIKNNKTIGLQNAERLGLGLEIGDNLTLQLKDDVSQDFIISSDYLFFPKIVERLPRYDPYSDSYKFNRVSIVGSIEMVTELGNLYGSVSSEILVKVAEGKDITEIVNKLRSIFILNSEIRIYSAIEIYSKQFNSKEVSLIINLIEGMLIITLICSVVAVFYFSINTLNERNIEIGVFRVFGMTQKQIFRLLLFEIMLIILTGLIYGTIMGFLISSNFMYLFTVENSQNAPGFKFYIPSVKILMFTIAVLGLTIISAAMPASLTSKKQSGRLLRDD